MPNIAQVLKEEIRRLAKKEARALTGKLKHDVVRLKKANVAMRRSVVQLKRDNDLLMASEILTFEHAAGRLTGVRVLAAA